MCAVLGPLTSGEHLWTIRYYLVVVPTEAAGGRMPEFKDNFPEDWIGRVVTVHYKGPRSGDDTSSYSVWESVGELMGPNELGILLDIGDKQHFIAYDAITSMIPVGGRR
jgi:hypothetical protein